MAHNLEYFDLEGLDSWIVEQNVYPQSDLVSPMGDAPAWRHMQDLSSFPHGNRPMMFGPASRTVSDDRMSSPSSSGSSDNYVWSVESPPQTALQPMPTIICGENERRIVRDRCLYRRHFDMTC